MKPSDLARYLRTVRYLKPSQMAWRLRRHLPHRPLRPPTPPPQPAEGRPACPLPHHPGPTGVPLLAEVKKNRLTLLNQTRELDPSAPDWRLGSRKQDRLWIITLHYHGWAYHLAAMGREGRQLFGSFVDDWIKRCHFTVPGALLLAWNPFAIATRLGWWARAYDLLGAEFWEKSPAFRRRFLESYALQAEWLSRNVEWDLRGNHLVRNALGLAWAGRFLDGPAAARRLAYATTLAVSQAREQVLEDGGHVERSPMYHQQVMEDFLALSHLLTNDRAKRLLSQTLSRMMEFAVWMRHPDGRIPLLNDAALNGSARPEEVPLVHGRRHFANSGIVVWHQDPFSIFFNVGSVGPDYQPGHAHADTLTVEMSYRGDRFIVDPGTFAYDDNARRAYDRATASHNVVALDDENSSEVWGIFRVGRRARVLKALHRGEESGTAFAVHNGYRHLTGRPLVSRALASPASDHLLITDHVVGSSTHRVSGGYLLAPGWTAEEVGAGWRISKGELSLFVLMQSDVNLRRTTVQAAYHPEFGREVNTVRLCWEYEGPLPLQVGTIIAERWEIS